MLKKFNISSVLLTALCLCLAACSGVIYDDQGDCDVHYRLTFRYDHNIKFADAFASEVGSVRVYAFSADNDRLVWVGEESGAQLARQGYSLELPLQPGKYRLIAWCGLDNAAGDDEHFRATDLSIGESAPQDLLVALQHQTDPATAARYSDRALYRLFHGSIDLELADLSNFGGTYNYVMPLMKDTNKVTIVLQNLSGKDLSPDDYRFTITSANATMAHNGDIADETPVEYRPHDFIKGTAGVVTPDAAGDEPMPQTSRAITETHIAGAELTTARLMKGRECTLHITASSDGHTVARLPITDYALLVKGPDTNGHVMSDQEYLDRQDHFTMTLFMDDRGEWLSSSILINSWRVVLSHESLGGGSGG